MSQSDSESETGSEGIPDDQLPEDLQPGEDNPLASPPEDEELDRDELEVLEGGKAPEESSDDNGDSDGGDGGDGSDDASG